MISSFKFMNVTVIYISTCNVAINTLGEIYIACIWLYAYKHHRLWSDEITIIFTCMNMCNNMNLNLNSDRK